MYRLKALKDLLARVKWKPVGAVFLVLLLAIILLFVLSSKDLFSSPYKGAGDVQAKVWADPARVELAGHTSVWVEVSNKGTGSQSVLVRMEIDDKAISFEESGNQKINRTIQLGSGESRRVEFPVILNALSGGKYGIKMTAIPRAETAIEDKVFLDVYEKK
jgi:uncharacterized protein (DUF58 family)